MQTNEDWIPPTLKHSNLGFMLEPPAKPPPVPPVPAVPAAAQPTQPLADTLAALIASVLADGEGWTSQAIAEKISAHPPSVMAALSRMYRKGKIDRSGTKQEFIYKRKKQK